jgi:hypothetical protein
MNIISQIKPAFDVAIKERLMIEAIANNPKALTLKTPSLKWNALVDFKRVMTVYGTSSNLNSPEFELSKGKWARYWLLCRVRFIKTKKLFKRIEVLYNSPTKKLTKSNKLWLNYNQFCQGRQIYAEARRKWLK